MKRFILILILLNSILFILSCSQSKTPTSPPKIYPTSTPTPSLKNWEKIKELKFLENHNYTPFIFKNKIWIVDEKNNIYYSQNGYNWISKTVKDFSCGNDFKYFIYKDNFIIICFKNKKIFKTNDFITFKDSNLVFLDFLKESNVFTFKDKIWMIYNGKIYYFSDEKNKWEKIKEKNIFKRDYELLLFKNKMWVIDKDRKVWNSDDCIDWKLITKNVNVKVFDNEKPFVYKNRMWIVNGKEKLNIYWSVNGYYWISKTAEPIKNIDDFYILPYNDKVFLISKKNKEDTIESEIWVSK